ncbi:CPBP family intramembrane glutamic endopeptidase [Agrobacterium sp. ES01]|uniref:CPBP family intramembrane glutamic endopeptidase n=1 Tax=Agrobacterium sp. ES01 TaxID=3420714 RepID=UPI003D116A02
MLEDKTASDTSTRIILSLVTLVLWTGVTFFGAQLLYPPEISLDELISRNIAWHILFACILLLLVIVWRGWRDMGFRHSRPGTLRLLWLPAVLIGVLLAGAALLGLPSVGVIALLLANALLVGFSEEVMFRGILYRALLTRFSIWPAILMTTVGFGVVHVLNGLITGDFGASMIQALTAASTGILLIAILIRTGSIWTSIIVHALWDWATFLLMLAAKAQAPVAGMEQTTEAASQSSFIGQVVIPVAVVLPGLLYGLWLLRRVGGTERGSV